jgi:mannosyltransferase
MMTRPILFPGKSYLLKFIFPLGLILLNLVLKIIFLDHRDISMDEPFTIFYAQTDFHTLFEMLRTENNPPLFFILLHFWIKVFGISAFSVRFMPMIFSTLTVLVIFLIGKKFFSLRIGLVAALIFTFSNYHLLFAHEARVYSLFALLASVSMLLFLQLSIRQDLRTIIFLAFINLMLLYSHFFGFYIIFIQLTSCFLIKELRITILKWYFFILVIDFVFYIPYLSVFISRLWLSSTHGTWVPQPIISDLYNMAWKFSNTPVTTV